MSRALRVLAAPATEDETRTNPYITRLYEEVQRQGVTVQHLDRRALVLDRFDVVHVHWPEQLVRWRSRTSTAVLDVAKVLGGLLWARLRGARLIWTGHDLRPHEVDRPWLMRAFLGSFTRMVDAAITLADSAVEPLLEAFPALTQVPVFVVPHGHYLDSYPRADNRAEARAQLGVDEDATVVLLLGRIRPYKNVPELIRTFATVAEHAQLVVAGWSNVDDALTAEVEKAAAESQNALLLLRLIPAHEVSALHAAADVVFLPYSAGSSLHSGAALLAVSLGRPVVVRDTPVMRELRRTVGPDWVVPFGGDMPAGLRLALEVARRSLPPEPPDLAHLDWPDLAASTIRVYQETVARPHRRPRWRAMTSRRSGSGGLAS